MNLFFSYFIQCFFPLNHVFFCLAYQLPLQKRPHGNLRLLICLAVGMLFSPFLVLLGTVFLPDSQVLLRQTFYYWSIFIFLILQLLSMVLLFWFDCDISLADAVYGTACAYSTQHLSDAVIMLLFPERAFSQVYVFSSLETFLGELPAFLISLATLLGGYFLVARRLPEKGRYQNTTAHSWLAASIVLGFALFLSYAAKILLSSSGTAMFRICMAFDLLCCVFMLWVQVEHRHEMQLIREVQIERVIRARQKEQFIIARDSVERINRKCHNLKHQVAAIRRIADSDEQQKSLAELEKAVAFYDFMVKSGNEVIDTVLTEKSLLCEQSGITWTCMANGPTLEFMEPGDLYLLFDSALENAIESVRCLSDEKQRIIALTLHRKRDMAFLQIENYYSGSLVFEHGLPRSTKPQDGVHGYGLKNIQAIVQKYHGTMDISAENGLFLLSILLPLPDSAI